MYLMYCENEFSVAIFLFQHVFMGLSYIIRIVVGGIPGVIMISDI